jgi:threonine synthase
LIRKPVKYYSTNRKAPEVTFREALLKGLAPDGGLYMPVSIPRLRTCEIDILSTKTYPEIAAFILSSLIGNEIESSPLSEICREAYNFEVPLEKADQRKYVMRLDRGPTASFKDFAARLMARVMQYFLENENHHVVILTATSGDTGSAVANAFLGLKNIDVIILFPEGEVTEVQRRQMTTLKNNIKVFALDGKFDDCQQIVKRAFTDPDLSGIPLSSANSINIGRLLPQSVYYFYAWSRLAEKQDNNVVFSVPSGNFGNIMGGLIAKKMGLPVRCFVISTNENDEVPVYLQKGYYSIIKPSRNCISSAMNVGHPSNMARIISLYGGMMNEEGVIIAPPDLEKMRMDFFAVSVTDKETRDAISNCYKKSGLLLEPHGSTAWYALEKYLNQNPQLISGKQLCVSLETAHPSKFPEEITPILNFSPPLHPSLIDMEYKNEEYIQIENNYCILRDFLVKNYQIEK